jgi:hypothetical protein
MGNLLGPRPLQEIVITRYENDRVNFQIEGMKGPVAPRDAYQLLLIVANEMTKQMAMDPAPKETPSE